MVIGRGIQVKAVEADPESSCEGQRGEGFVAPHGTNPIAPTMPLAKERDLLLMGNFALDANANRFETSAMPCADARPRSGVHCSA